MSDSHGAPVPPYNQSTPQPWERELVTKLAEHALAEQRRARRWGIFLNSLRSPTLPLRSCCTCRWLRSVTDWTNLTRL